MHLCQKTKFNIQIHSAAEEFTSDTRDLSYLMGRQKLSSKRYVSDKKKPK